MPASAPYLRRLRVDVSKKFITAASSHEGEFDTSTTTEAPFSTSASPSPVSVLTPEFGDAAIASYPCSRNFVTSFDPMSPLPPITTIFTIASFISTEAFQVFGWESLLFKYARASAKSIVSRAVRGSRSPSPEVFRVDSYRPRTYQYRTYRQPDFSMRK